MVFCREFAVLICAIMASLRPAESSIDLFSLGEHPVDSVETREDILQLEVTTEPTTTQVEKVDNERSCGGVYNTNEGTISSPGYPINLYPSNVNCTWLITVEERKVITMKFKYMDVEVGPPACPFDGLLIMDHLEIWEKSVPRLYGPVMQNIEEQYLSTTLGRFCGQKQIMPLFSTTNRVRINFYSDGESEGLGFELTWVAVDAPESKDSDGEIKPCNNEEDYPCMNSSECIPDNKICDGEFDCPLRDDESEFFCIFNGTAATSVNATAAVPTLPEDTTYHEFETSIIMETTDVAANADTTVPEWMEELTTFVLNDIASESDKAPNDEKTTEPAVVKATTSLSFTTQTRRVTTRSSTIPAKITTQLNESSTVTDAKNRKHDVTKPTVVSGQMTGNAFNGDVTMVTKNNEATSEEKPALLFRTTAYDVPTAKTTTETTSETHGGAFITSKSSFALSFSANRVLSTVAVGPRRSDRLSSDNHGSSAGSSSSKQVLRVCLLGFIVQWVLNKP